MTCVQCCWLLALPLWLTKAVLLSQLIWFAMPGRAQYGPVYVCGGLTLPEDGGNGPGAPAQL